MASKEPNEINGSVSRTDTMEQEYVLLESFPTPHDAHLVANLLRTVDIPAKILDESIVSVLPILEMALGGVKVMVPRNHL